MAELAMVTSLLKQLNMNIAASNIDKIIAEASLTEETPLAVLDTVLKTEMDGRNKRSKEKRLKAACLPFVEDLDNFDFNRKGFKGVTKSHMMQLADLAWLEESYNIMFLGPTGLGKTRLSIGLGLKAIEKGYNVAFVTLDGLMRILKTAEINSTSARRLKHIKSCEMVILDEVGFLPISKQEANFLYEFVNALYRKTSIVLTSNKSFEEWSEFIGDPVITAAILERLAHYCEIFALDGPSYRMENRKTIFNRNTHL